MQVKYDMSNNKVYIDDKVLSVLEAKKLLMQLSSTISQADEFNLQVEMLEQNILNEEFSDDIIE